jgi:hypothetical protein
VNIRVRPETLTDYTKQRLHSGLQPAHLVVVEAGEQIGTAINRHPLDLGEHCRSGFG